MRVSVRNVVVLLSCNASIKHAILYQPSSTKGHIITLGLAISYFYNVTVVILLRTTLQIHKELQVITKLLLHKRLHSEALNIFNSN